MKNYLAIPILLCLGLQLNAATFYDQLCAFNFNWKKYYMRAPAGAAQDFSCDRELKYTIQNGRKMVAQNGQAIQRVGPAYWYMELLYARRTGVQDGRIPDTAQ